MGRPGEGAPTRSDVGEWTEGALYPNRIATERLTMTRLAHDTVDLFDLHAFFAAGDDNAEKFEYWDSAPHETVKETQAYVDEARRSWTGGGDATYVIRPNAGEDGADQIAGVTRLQPDWETRAARLRIILASRYWGRGYSGERADALLAVAFERLGLDVVVAVHIDGNEQSRRAIAKYVERHGGRYEGMLRNGLSLPDDVADVHRYTIAREEYRVTADA